VIERLLDDWLDENLGFGIVERRRFWLAEEGSVGESDGGVR
jgi:hypothetical protein